jgi:phosphatidylethanolamine/phosphatidyl-N-methylethanolamine N-methyltransferase
VIDMTTDIPLFLRRAARRPGLLGAPAPTGSRLAARVAAVVPADRAMTIVELGAGTGALTTAVAARLAPGSRFVAIELDPVLAAHLRAACPEVEVVEGDAVDVVEILAGLGIDRVDAVVSSLPWTFLPPAVRRDLLAGIARLLAPDGVFTLIRVLVALPSRVRVLRDDLAGAFADVREDRPVWRNLPPAALVSARRPVRGA